MAFSQSSITEVTIQPDGSDLIISWESVAPYGTIPGLSRSPTVLVRQIDAMPRSDPCRSRRSKRLD